MTTEVKDKDKDKGKTELDRATFDKALAFLNHDRKKGTRTIFGGGAMGFIGAGCLMRYLTPEDQDKIRECFGYKELTRESIQDKGDVIHILLQGRYRTSSAPKTQVTAHVPKTDFLAFGLSSCE